MTPRVELGAVARDFPTVEQIATELEYGGPGRRREQLTSLRDSAWLEIERYCRYLFASRTASVTAVPDSDGRVEAIPYWRPVARSVTAFSVWDDSAGWEAQQVTGLKVHPGGYVQLADGMAGETVRLSFTVGATGTPDPDILEAVIRLAVFSFEYPAPGGEHMASLAGRILKSGAGSLLGRYRGT